MNRLWRSAFVLLFLLGLSTAAYAQSTAMLPAAENLEQLATDAEAAGRPLVLLFSLPDCPYCKVVRRNYLGPMLREPNPPVIRELTMTSRQSLRDYDGGTTTPAALARRYGVVVAPTLVFVDADGEMLADPLVGGDNQFYIAYLDRAFDESHKKLAARKKRGQ